MDFVKPDVVIQELRKLQRHNTFTVDTATYSFDGRIQEVFYYFTFGPSCYGNKLFGIRFGDLFLYADSHILQYMEGQEDYEVLMFNFNVLSELSTDLLGFSDDNWSDGTQSYVFEFLLPTIYEFGLGFTWTTMHEVGHHLGMSHPHDGDDSELNLDYGATAPTYYS
jgi:hypothetical protein